MSERLGFALVLLVGMASLASILFLSGTASTGAITMHPPTSTECKHVRCPGNELAYPLLDAQGNVLYHDKGFPICICPPR
jgi:hypothetical protein